MTVLRDERASRRVTQIELFFDLVYVFAVTQLAELIGQARGADGVMRTAILLAMVWQVWVYTAWLTNYLDPNHHAIRFLLVVLMLASLVLAAEIPHAFGRSGLLVALLYVFMQLGRSLYASATLRGHDLRFIFLRLNAWSALSAVPIVIGGLSHGHVRETLWALGVAIEVGGAAIGFATPGLGRSQTLDWNIDGGHFAERGQAFVLIALGESVVVSGTTLSGLEHVHASEVVAFGMAFGAVVALWWVYFDRAAEDSARKIAESEDPGRLGRSAFHWVHPLIIGGVIVTAAATHDVLDHPLAHGSMKAAGLMLGGTALFLGGHAVFKAVMWRVPSWPRILAVPVLLLLVLLAPHVTSVVLGIPVIAVILAVIVTDRVGHPEPE
jgi:low temperature requirement protein LtrA